MKCKVISEDYLPLAYLNAWEYCPRRFYFEYVLGEMADNEHLILGRHLHRHINESETVQEGDTLIHKQQWVWSDLCNAKKSRILRQVGGFVSPGRSVTG
jgi:CRISPR/Cas system-associated exonuclease Cas4 (RecB family)